MNVKDETLRAAVLGALRDMIDGEYTHARGEALDALLQLYREHGTLSVGVNLQDGTTVATVTLVQPTDEVAVVDRAAFTAWVREQAPEMVDEEPSPLDRVEHRLSNYGVPHARMVAQSVLAELGIDEIGPPARVSKSYEAALLEAVKPVGNDKGTRVQVVYPETGEIVPGVEYRNAGEPNKFRMLYKPTSADGRQAIADAWREGRLPAIEGLPEVES